MKNTVYANSVVLRKAKFHTLAAVTLAAFLSACGGGESSPAEVASTPTVPPRTAQPNNVIVETYGDSTMAGWTRPDANSPFHLSANPAPSVLQADLTATLGSGILVSNQGVASTTSFMLYYGTDGYHYPWDQQMTVSQAKVVVINHGINDALGQGVNISLYDYDQLLSALIVIGRQHGKTVVLEEPNPVCVANASLLDSYVNTMNAVAVRYGAPIIHQYDDIKNLPNWQAMVPDCIHPNDDLYRFKGNRQMQVVGPLVAALR